MKKQLTIIALLTAFASPVYADIVIEACDGLEVGDACETDGGKAGKCDANRTCVAIADTVEDDEDSCTTTGGTSSFLTMIAGLLIVGVSRVRR